MQDSEIRRQDDFLSALRRLPAAPQVKTPLDTLRDMGVDLSGMNRRPDVPLDYTQRNDAQLANVGRMGAEWFDALSSGRRSDVNPKSLIPAAIEAGVTKVAGQTVGAIAGSISSEISSLQQFPSRVLNWTFRQISGQDIPEWFDEKYESAFGSPPPAIARFAVGMNLSGDAINDEPFENRRRVLPAGATPSEAAAAVGDYDMYSVPGIARAIGSAGTQVVTAILMASIPGGQGAGAAAAASAATKSLSAWRGVKALLTSWGGRAYLGYMGGRQGIGMANDYRDFIENEQAATDLYNSSVSRLGLSDVLGLVDREEHSRGKEIGLAVASGAMTAASELIGTGFSVAGGRAIAKRLMGRYVGEAGRGGMRGVMREAAKRGLAAGGMEGLEEVVDGFGQEMIRSIYDYNVEGGFSYADRRGERADPLRVLRNAGPELFYDFAIAFAVTAPIGVGGAVAQGSRRRRIHDAFEMALLRDRASIAETGRSSGRADFIASRIVEAALEGKGDPELTAAVIRRLREEIPEIGSATAEKISDPEWVSRFVEAFPMVAVRLAEAESLSRANLEWLTGGAARGKVPNTAARARFHELVRERVRALVPEYMRAWHQRSAEEVAAWRSRLNELGDRTDDEAMLVRMQASQRIQFIRGVMRKMRLSWINRETVSQEQFQEWIRLTDEVEAVDFDGTADARETSPATARRASPEVLALLERAREGRASDVASRRATLDVGAGDVDAMLELSSRYERGDGVEANFAKSQYWFNRALAASGDVEAMVLLGKFYEGRIGTFGSQGGARSLDKARAYYREAYRRGSDEAGALLGEMESRGGRVPVVPRPGRIDRAEAQQAARGPQAAAPVAPPAEAPASQPISEPSAEPAFSAPPVVAESATTEPVAAPPRPPEAAPALVVTSSNAQSLLDGMNARLRKLFTPAFFRSVGFGKFASTLEDPENRKPLSYDQVVQALYEGIRSILPGQKPYSDTSSDAEASTGESTDQVRVEKTMSWHYRLPVRYNKRLSGNKITERVSLNVDWSPDLIDGLDGFFAARADSDTGQAVGYYKTPSQAGGWSERHDPITIYLSRALTPNEMRELVAIVQPHVRTGATVNNLIGERVVDGVFLVPNPQTSDWESLFARADRIDPFIRYRLTPSVMEDGKYKGSAGQYSAITRLIEILEADALAEAPAPAAPAPPAPVAEPAPPPGPFNARDPATGERRQYLPREEGDPVAEGPRRAAESSRLQQAEQVERERVDLQRQVRDETGDQTITVRFVESSTDVERKIGRAANRIGRRVQYVEIRTESGEESGIRGFIGRDPSVIYLVRVPSIGSAKVETAYYLQTLMHESGHGLVREADAETLRAVDALVTNELLVEMSRFDLGRGDAALEEIRVHTLTLGVVDAAAIDGILLAETSMERAAAALKDLFSRVKIILTGNERAALLRRMVKAQVERAKAPKAEVPAAPEPAPAPAPEPAPQPPPPAAPAAAAKPEPAKKPPAKRKPKAEPVVVSEGYQPPNSYAINSLLQDGVNVEVMAGGKPVSLTQSSASRGTVVVERRGKVLLLEGKSALEVTGYRPEASPVKGKAQPKRAAPEPAAQVQPVAEPSPPPAKAPPAKAPARKPQAKRTQAAKTAQAAKPKKPPGSQIPDSVPDGGALILEDGPGSAGTVVDLGVPGLRAAIWAKGKDREEILKGLRANPRRGDPSMPYAPAVSRPPSGKPIKRADDAGMIKLIDSRTGISNGRVRVQGGRIMLIGQLEDKTQEVMDLRTGSQVAHVMEGDWDSMKGLFKSLDIEVVGDDARFPTFDAVLGGSYRVVGEFQLDSQVESLARSMAMTSSLAVEGATTTISRNVGGGVGYTTLIERKGLGDTTQIVGVGQSDVVKGGEPVATVQSRTLLDAMRMHTAYGAFKVTIATSKDRVKLTSRVPGRGTMESIVVAASRSERGLERGRETLEDTIRGQGVSFMRERTESQLVADHAAAFRRGDADAATEMVREYARRKGYDEAVWRGDAEMEFPWEYPRSQRREPGVFTAKDPFVAGLYASSDGSGNGVMAIERYPDGRVQLVPQVRKFLVGGRRLDLERRDKAANAWLAKWAKDAGWDFLDRSTGESISVYDAVDSGRLFDMEGDWSASRWADLQKTARADGYDLMVVPDFHDATTSSQASVVVLSEGKMKLADPFTYDSDGNLIPLDKRFDDSTPDVRFMREVAPIKAVKSWMRSIKPSTAALDKLQTDWFWEYSVLDREIRRLRKEMDLPPELDASDKFQVAPGLRDVQIVDLHAKELQPMLAAARDLAKRTGMTELQVLDLVKEYAFAVHALDVMAYFEGRMGEAEMDRLRRRAEKTAAALDEDPEAILAGMLEDMNSLGYTSDQAIDRIAELDRQFASDSGWMDLVQRLRDVNRKTLEMRRDAGLITEQAYQTVLKRYPNYVPVVRSIFSPDVTDRGSINTTRNTRARSMDRMVGGRVGKPEEMRTFWAASLALTAYDRMQVASQAAINRADNALFRLALGEDRTSVDAATGEETGGRIGTSLVEPVFVADLLRDATIRANRSFRAPDRIEGESDADYGTRSDLERARHVEREISRERERIRDRQSGDNPDLRRVKMERETDATPGGRDAAVQRAEELRKAGDRKGADEAMRSIRILQKGELVHYRITDPILAAAMLTRSPSFLERARKEGGPVLRRFAAAWLGLMSFSRFAFVNASLTFQLGELMRSPQQAYMMASIMADERGLPKAQKDRFIEEVGRRVGSSSLWPIMALKGALRAMPGSRRWRSAAHVLKGGDPRNEFEQLVRDAMEDGVMMGSLYSVENFDAMRSRLIEDLQSLEEGGRTGVLGRLRNAGSVVSNALDLNTSALDFVNRMSVYESAVAAGVDRQTAAVMARESTVDFGRKGVKAKSLGQSYLFLSPRLQGVQQLLRAFEETKGQGSAALAAKGGSATRRAVAKYFLWSFMLGLAREFFFEDDEDPQTMTSKFTRERSMLMPLPWQWQDGTWNWVQLNNPYGFGAIAKAGDTLAEAIAGDIGPTQALAETAGAIVAEMLPVTVSDRSSPLAYVQALVPTNLSPLADAMLNRDFRGAPIAPVGAQFGAGDMRTSQKYYANTPAVYVWVASMLSDLTGPIARSAEGPGNRGIEISPNHIQYVIERYMPGVVRSALDGVATIRDEVEGTRRGIDRIPVVSSLLGQSGGRRVMPGLFRDYDAIARQAKEDLKVDSFSTVKARYGAVGVWMARPGGAWARANSGIKKLQEARNRAVQAGDRQAAQRFEDRMNRIRLAALRAAMRVESESGGGVGLDTRVRREFFERSVLRIGEEAK